MGSGKITQNQYWNIKESIENPSYDTVTMGFVLPDVNVDGLAKKNGWIEQSLSGKMFDKSGQLVLLGFTASQSDSIAIGPGDAVGLVGVAGIVAVGASVVWTYEATPELLEKFKKEVTQIKTKAQGPKGVQYSLRARVNGEYPDVRNGTIYLRAGDVWKYGETTKKSRYSNKWLKESNLIFTPEFVGTRVQIKIAEKVKLYRYFIDNESLPPGNKIFI